MSVAYLQKRIKELEERVQELEDRLAPCREVEAKDIPKLRERPTEYWSHRPVRDLRAQEVHTDDSQGVQELAPS